MDFKTLSVLPLRGVVLFPHVLAHFDVGRDGSIEAINRAVKADNMIFVTAQKNAMDEVADTENIYEIGTVAIIRQVIKVADRGYRVILEGLYRAQAVEFVHEKDYISCECAKIFEFSADMSQIENLAKFR